MEYLESSFSLKSTVFVVRWCEKVELPNLGSGTSTRRIRGIARHRIDYDLVLHIWKRCYWPLFLWKPVSHKEDLQTNDLLIFPQLRDYPRDMVSEQDGPPLHFSLVVWHYLGQKVLSSWIIRVFPITWPLRSSDLITYTFCLWGHIKDRIFNSLPTTVNEMKTSIPASIPFITKEAL